MKSLRSIYRAAATLLLFALFGIGGLLLAPAALLLRDIRFCTALIRISWVPLVKLFELAGLIKVDVSALSKIRGSVIAANHPSLIDVVVLIAAVPKTLFVAKHVLKKNPFVSALVANASLPDDERLVDAAEKFLRKGWNVLVFPEGTRTSACGVLHTFKRGAAQLAIRSGVPLVPLAIKLSPFRILGKRQSPCDMGSERVTYRLETSEPLAAAVGMGESLHSAAKRVTCELQAAIKSLLA